MRLLFDTHSFMWWDSSSVRLPAHVRALCHDRSNTLLLSVASAWEIQIKVQLGKLQLPGPLQDVIAHHEQTNQMRLLPVTLDHVLALQGLPHHHRDPFDRLLVAVALAENAVLMTNDPIMSQYPVQIVW